MLSSLLLEQSISLIDLYVCLCISFYHSNQRAFIAFSLRSLDPSKKIF